jgi:cell division protein FtsQ
VAKTNANSGGATLLEDESADVSRLPGSRQTDARWMNPSRPARTAADPDEDAGEPFLRARRRVPVRRGLLPLWARTGWGRLAFAGGILTAAGACAALLIATRSFLDHDPRFRIASSASIQTLGQSQLSRADLLSVFGSDIGRNLFFVPLAQRRTELEQIPWVRQAIVMRVLPNQLRVSITERVPIAFVDIRGRIALADEDGVILPVTPKQMADRHYSFPVVSGINPADPLSIRGARMHMYQRFISELDSTGEHFSAQLSEVDLSDPDDVRATVPANGSDLLLHFGEDDFLPRWRNYQTHLAQWEQQYPHLGSIDLRYDDEVVLKMAGDPGTGPAPRAAPTSAPKSAPKSEAKSAPKRAVAHAAPPARSAKTHKVRPAKHLPAKGHASPSKSSAKRGTAA